MQPRAGQGPGAGRGRRPRRPRRSALRAGLAAPRAALARAARNRALVRLQLAWAAVMVASWTATVSLSVVAFTEGGSAAVALAVLARTVPGAVAGPAVGALVDRYPRQRCLLWAAGLSALAAGGAAVATRSPVAVVALVSVVALATMLFRTAQSAIVPELVDEPADLTAANVLSSAVESLGVFAGPALAGVLLAVHGPGLALGAAAVLFVAGGALLLGLGGPAGDGSRTAPGARGSVLDLARLRTARVVLGLVFAQTVVSGGLLVLYPSLAVRALHVDVSAVGLLTAAFGLGGVLGSVAVFTLAGSPRLGLLTVWALLLWSVPLLVVPAAAGVAPVLAVLLVVGGGNVLFDVTSVTLLQRGVPGRLAGRAFGAVETAYVLGVGAGAAAAAVLDRTVGPGPAVAVLGSGLVVVAALAVRSLRRLDVELAAPTREVGLLRTLPAFALLPPFEIERLALHLQHHACPAGEVVVRQGDPGSTWFLIGEGELEVAVDGRTVRELGPGESFGEVALLRAGVRTATVSARTPAELWSLDGAVFVAALSAHDGRALAAVDALADERLAHAAPAPRDG